MVNWINVKCHSRSHYSIKENESEQNVDKRYVLSIPKVYNVKIVTESGTLSHQSNSKFSEDIKIQKQIGIEELSLRYLYNLIQGVGYFD